MSEWVNLEWSALDIYLYICYMYGICVCVSERKMKRRERAGDGKCFKKSTNNISNGGNVGKKPKRKKKMDDEAHFTRRKWTLS